ncbi:MAG: acylphosphatase [Thermomicrobiales bacterium]|nr:acylphosphatase [Thermomicrobiales bacterium]
MKRHLSIRVYGRVQGVFFRQTAKEQALRLGLTGYARNEADGTVQIEVEGEATAVDRFLAWSRVGPPAARVDRVETRAGELAGYAGFKTM